MEREPDRTGRAQRRWPVAEEPTASDAGVPIAQGECPEFLEVILPESVCGNVRVLRHLCHRVVDLMADHGKLDWLINDVQYRLEYLSVEITCDYVTGLIREAEAMPGVSRPPDPKPGADRPPDAN